MKTRRRPFPTSARQSGVALITGLVLMVVLTLITVAALRTTTLEELMARNARDRDLAFQAAEAALRAGETELRAPCRRRWRRTRDARPASPTARARNTGRVPIRGPRSRLP